jgi:hypothetical protein
MLKLVINSGTIETCFKEKTLIKVLPISYPSGAMLITHGPIKTKRNNKGLKCHFEIQFY